MDLARYLENLDFTRYERGAILALAGVEDATAVQLVKAARIPQGRVYDVMQALVDKGIVHVIPGSPKRFTVPDVKERLAFYLQMKENRLIGKQRALKGVTVAPKMFSLRPARSVAAFTGRDEHVRAISMLRRAAKKQLLQCAPLFIGSFSSHRDLEAALQRGVEVKVITLRETAKNRAQVKLVRDLGGEVRVLNRKDLLSLTIRDGKDVLLGAQNYREHEERVTILTRNAALCDAMLGTFRELWKKARPI